MVPLPQQRQQKGKKRGEAAWLQEATPLLHGEGDGDGHNHPTATVTARANPGGSRDVTRVPAERDGQWGFSKRERIWIAESVPSSVPNHPREPARRGYSAHKSGSRTNFQLSVSVHLNHFQIFSTSPV